MIGSGLSLQYWPITYKKVIIGFNNEKAGLKEQLKL